MAIRLRRGTDTQRLSVVFEEGEIVYTTDTKKVYLGDGITAGGNEIGGTTAAELLKVSVHNATGSTLNAGQVVYLSGNTGNTPNAVLAQANSEATSSKTIGLIIANISNNANGQIATDGLLDGLNTSMFSAGAMLWLSETTPGGVTVTAPDTPNHAVFIGYVTRSHPTEGAILIHIQNGYELNELHDVKIDSVADGDSLIYDEALGYWKNSDQVTTQGNTFNAANKLVQLDASAKLPAVDGSQLTNLPLFSPPNGLLRLANAISTTLQSVTDYLGNLSVLQLNSRSLGIASDSGVTTQTTAVIQATTTNSGIAIVPNGTGAITAQVPDGTVAGGNARGAYAVDLQTSRSNANQVASGTSSVVIGGFENRSSGNYSVSGGRGNIASSVDSIAFGRDNQSIGQATVVIGGQSNVASNSYSAILGGSNNVASGNWSNVSGRSNNASIDYATISGGQSNTVSTNTHATVVGGQSNTASGQYSVSGGISCIASGKGALSIGTNDPGAGNTASGIGAVALGGRTTASGNYSFTGGSTNTTNSGVASILYGEFSSNTGSYNSTFGRFNANTSSHSLAFGKGTKAPYTGSLSFQSATKTTNASDRGIAQSHQLTMQNTSALNSASSSILYIDGVSDALIPYTNNTAWNVQIDTIAVVTEITGTATGVSVGDTYSEVKNLLFKRIGGTSSIVGTVDTSFIKSNAGMSTAALTVTAGASQQMALTFTAPTFAGGGSVTCRVVSKVSLVEVAY